MSVSHSQLILVSSTTLRLLLSLALTILMGRVLSPADFGFYALVLTLFVIARELMDIGSGSLAVREISIAPEREKSILETLIGLRVVIGFGLAMASLVLATQQAHLYQVWVLTAVALVFPFLSIGTLAIVYQLRQDQVPPAIITLTLQAGMLVACLLIYHLQVPVWTYALMVIIREAIGLFWLDSHAAKTLGYSSRPRFDFEEIRRFMQKAIIVGTAATMYNLYFYIGPLLIWILRPAAEMGAYSAAFRPISPLLSFPWLLMLPLLPVLTRYAATDRSTFQQQASYLVPLFIALGAVAALTGMEISRDALLFLYADKYISGQLSATGTLELLSLSLVFSMATSAIVTIILADGREKLLVLICLLGLLVNLLCNFLFLPIYGFPASAFSTLVTEMCVAIAGFIVLLRSAIIILTWSSLMLFVLPPAVLAIVLQIIADEFDRYRLVLALLACFSAICILLQLPIVRTGRQQLARANVDELSK